LADERHQDGDLMNALQQALIEKAGHDHGFENTLSAGRDTVVLSSARHAVRVHVQGRASEYQVEVHGAAPTLPSELSRAFPGSRTGEQTFLTHGEAGLAQMLRRAAALAQALPNQPALDFDARVQAALQALPAGEARNTEVERLIRQRVGQQAYRQAMLDYWGGACAVTGVSVTEALRASHAKPWADCASDAERLDVFNGFLLCAHLDALFDRFLVSFDEAGALLVSSVISDKNRVLLGLDRPQHLRWLTPEHLVYLRYHRAQFAASMEVGPSTAIS